MKTKQLIEILQKLDPEGDTDVVFMDNTPIVYVDREYAWYDGRKLGAIYDGEGEEYRNIKGMYVTDEGSKIRLQNLELLDVLVNDLEAPFEVRSKTPWVKEEAIQMYLKTKHDAEHILKMVEAHEQASDSRETT